MSEDDELKPCPFCGGDAGYAGTSVWRAGKQKKLGVCRDCGACASLDLWNTRLSSVRREAIEEAARVASKYSDARGGKIIAALEIEEAIRNLLQEDDNG